MQQRCRAGRYPARFLGDNPGLDIHLAKGLASPLGHEIHGKFLQAQRKRRFGRHHKVARHARYMSPPFQGARKLQVPVQRQYDLGQVTDLISLGLDPAFVLLLLESRIEFFTQIGNQLRRSEEHTSELQSLMRISYAVFCLKKKTSIEDTQNQQKYISTY